MVEIAIFSRSFYNNFLEKAVANIFVLFLLQPSQIPGGVNRFLKESLFIHCTRACRQTVGQTKSDLVR